MTSRFMLIFAAISGFIFVALGALITKEIAFTI